MKRTLTVVFASLLAVAVIAPGAAQGATKYRYFQDLNVSGPFAGEISLAVLYKDKRGNRKFTAREVHAYDLQVKTSCNPGGEAVLDFGGHAFSKFNYFRVALNRKGRFAHRFENQAEVPEVSGIRGELKGRVLRRLKRGKKVTRPPRVNGAFNVEDWDPNSGVKENCISYGSYSATPCKRWRSKRDRPRWYRKWKVPVCSIDPW